MQVYHNATTSQAIISHRGTNPTPKDWLNNIAYHAGLYKYTPRYKHGKKIQQEAEAKYGADNINTIGHSQGAMLAAELGKNTKNVIAMNRPVTWRDALHKTGNNHYDIRSSADPISMLQPFQTKSNKDIVIPSNSMNPFAEHSYDKIRDLGDETVVGNGIIKIKRLKIHIPFVNLK